MDPRTHGVISPSELKLAENELIVMIIRGGETIIPNGTTVMKANDLVVTYK